MIKRTYNPSLIKKRRKFGFRKIKNDLKLNKSKKKLVNKNLIIFNL